MNLAMMTERKGLSLGDRIEEGNREEAGSVGATLVRLYRVAGILATSCVRGSIDSQGSPTEG